MGFWDRVRGWFGRRTPARSTAPQPPAPTAPSPALRVIQGGKAEATPFDQLIAWTGLVVPVEAPLTQPQQEAEDQLAQKVLAHYQKNRPAPSSLPAVALRVLNAVAEPDVSLSELSRLIGQDPALSAGVLKVANSPVYMGAQEIQTLRDAVTRLGIAELSRIAGTVAARSLFHAQVRSEFARFSQRFTEVIDESVITARTAAWLAMKVRGGHSDQAFLAGMLHDLGRAVALRSMASLALAGEAIDPTDARVGRVVERVHVEIGGEVHAAWNLPRFATLVAMRHHDLGLPADGEYVDVHVVRLVSALAQLRHLGWRYQAIREEVNESCAALRVDAFMLRAVETQLKEEAAVHHGLAQPRVVRAAGAVPKSAGTGRR